MSQGNVEIVKALFDRWGTDDWRQIVSEDVVWEASAGDFADLSGTYRGHVGVSHFFRNWLGPWDTPAVELLEAADAGDAVFVAMRWRGRGRTSGVMVERDFFGVYEVRDRMIVRFRLCTTREEALAAAGLEP